MSTPLASRTVMVFWSKSRRVMMPLTFIFCPAATVRELAEVLSCASAAGAALKSPSASVRAVRTILLETLILIVV